MKKSTVKNKTHYIPREQLEEFLVPGGPDYAKLCAEALIATLPKSEREAAADRFEKSTGKKVSVFRG